jgi:Ni,Fe-hydrogenase III small subunit
VYPRLLSTTVVASVILLTVKYPAVSTYTACPLDNHAVLPTDTDTVLDTAGIVNDAVVVVNELTPSVPLVPSVPGSPLGPGAMTTFV